MRRFCAFFCVLLTLCCSFSASAMVVTCEIPELYMELDLPLSWFALTRHAEADDPGLYFYDDSLETMLDVFESQNLYLDAIDLDSMLELAVIMTPNEEIFDLSLWDDDFVNEAADYFAENPVWAGESDVQCFRTEDYYQAGARFLTYNRTEVQDDVALSCFQMSTVYNGQSIHFILIDYSGTLSFESGALAQAMYDIADTLVFTETLPLPDDLSDPSGIISGEPEGSSALDNVTDDMVEIITSLIPLMIVAVFAVLGRRTKVRQKKQTSAPRPRTVPMTQKRRQTPQVPPVPKPASAPVIPAKKQQVSQVGRPVQPAPDRRPKHNCASENGPYPLDRGNETVFCLDCGNKVFVRQKRCPRCGARVV